MKLADFYITEENDKNDKEQKCRGCGKPEIVMKGLCKECAEDTYADKD